MINIEMLFNYIHLQNCFGKAYPHWWKWCEFSFRHLIIAVSKKSLSHIMIKHSHIVATTLLSYFNEADHASIPCTDSLLSSFYQLHVEIKVTNTACNKKSTVPCICFAMNHSIVLLSASRGIHVFLSSWWDMMAIRAYCGCWDFAFIFQ